MRNEHSAAVLALLNAKLNALTIPWHAYEADDAPKQGGNYVAITLTRRFGGNVRNGGPISPSTWRLTTRAVGKGKTNAALILDKCSEALEDKTITVTSVTSTPFAFEIEDPIAEDEANSDLWSGLISWTYGF